MSSSRLGLPYGRPYRKEHSAGMHRQIRNKLEEKIFSSFRGAWWGESRGRGRRPKFKRVVGSQVRLQIKLVDKG